MPEKADSVQIPSCSGTPNIEITVGVYKPALDFSAIIKNKPFFENNELYFTHTISSTTTEYASGRTVNASSTTINKENNSYGFNLVIPGFEAKLPSYIIPKWPIINSGCNDCINDDWPKLCDWKKKEFKVCEKFMGKKICLEIPVPQPTKCINEIGFIRKTFPAVDFFTLKKTEIGFSFKVIPEIETDTLLSFGAVAGGSATIGDKPEVSSKVPIVNFTINTCKIGLKIQIEKLTLSYGGEGVNIKNIIIPVLPTIDIFPGENLLTSEADALGNFKLWYLIKSASFSLYDILNVGLNVIEFDKIKGIIGKAGDETGATQIPIAGNLLEHVLSFKPPEIVINFLKQTRINIACGLLICPLPRPDEKVFLSFVTSAWVTLAPFKNLNAIKIPEIPEEYTKIPKIPNSECSKFLPSDLANLINEEVQKATKIPLQIAAKEIVNIGDYIKKNIENIEVTVLASLPIPLIPKKPP